MTILPGKTTTIKLIDLTKYLEAEGLIITKPIYYKWIDGVKTPILTVAPAKAKSLAGQGETQNVHHAETQ